MLFGHSRSSRYVFLLAFGASASWASIANAQSTDAGTQAPPPDAIPQAPSGARRAPLMTSPASSDVASVPPATTAMPNVDPANDDRKLAQQGAERPSSDGSIATRPSEVFSEDWWGRARPILELHGYFRTRSELLHNFALGRQDPSASSQNLWPYPKDFSYRDTGKDNSVPLCLDEPGKLCSNKSQAGANMRLRLAPELHISDNLRILSQIDALDNLVLGSTSDAYSRYAPIPFLSTTQGAPTAGQNGYRNSIEVKRAWAEYNTPVGQLRFGRMPFNWGLGMLYNSGDGVDSDWQTTYDRIMFASGIKSADLYFGGSWDFMSSGATNANANDVYGGQPSNLANLANVNQWSIFVARRKNPELQRLALSRGDLVLNGGLVAQYRSQYLDAAPDLISPNGKPLDPNAAGANNNLIYRGGRLFTPDIWVQALWKKFRFEAEFAAQVGSLDITPENTNPDTPVRIAMFGLTTQTEFLAVEDKLHLNFGFGWASGDANAESLNSGERFQKELNNGRGPISTFRFHPDYRLDLIFWRRIMTRVQGAYYFRPSVDYDFVKNANGQRLGGGGAIIWSRASEFTQTPGHKRDLGVELNLQLYYQAKDGALNDDPSQKHGGFFAMLQYGVFFPMGGLGYLPGQAVSETSSAQTVRLFLGVSY
jgi:uncharacterized protein (TIGR04551 family)